MLPLSVRRQSWLTARATSAKLNAIYLVIMSTTLISDSLDCDFEQQGRHYLHKLFF